MASERHQRKRATYEVAQVGVPHLSFDLKARLETRMTREIQKEKQPKVRTGRRISKMSRCNQTPETTLVALTTNKGTRRAREKLALKIALVLFTVGSCPGVVQSKTPIAYATGKPIKTESR